MLKNRKKCLMLSLMLVLSISCLIAILVIKNKNHTHQFVNGVCKDCGEAQGSVLDDKGEVLDSDEIILMPAKLTFTKSTDAAKQITVQATLEPIEATDQNVNWSISFQNSSNEWAQKKNVEDYILLTKNGLSATLQCLQPFGEEIILKCSSVSKPSISSECVLNYLQRANLNCIFFEDEGGNTFDTDGSLEIECFFGNASVLMTANIFMRYDDYTEPSEFETTFQMIIADEFLTYLEQKKLKPSKTCYDFKIGDQIDLTVTSLIKMFGLSPDSMGNQYTENQVSNIFYGYDGMNKPIFDIVAYTVNKKDASNSLTTTFTVTTSQWAFDVAVQSITLNKNELQF